MSTWAGIGMELDPNSRLITYVTVAGDGYPNDVGIKLLRGYNTVEKAKALIDGGAILQLGEIIGEKHPYKKVAGPVIWTTYTARDSGRTAWRPALTATGAAHFETCVRSAGCEYVYLLREGEWQMLDHGVLTPLEEGLTRWLATCLRQPKTIEEQWMERISAFPCRTGELGQPWLPKPYTCAKEADEGGLPVWSVHFSKDEALMLFFMKAVKADPRYASYTLITGEAGYEVRLLLREDVDTFQIWRWIRAAHEALE